MARFNHCKNGGFSSSFFGCMLAGLILVGMLIGGFAIYNHYENKTDEITENVEVETEVETPSEEVVENEA